MVNLLCIIPQVLLTFERTPFILLLFDDSESYDFLTKQSDFSICVLYDCTSVFSSEVIFFSCFTFSENGERISFQNQWKKKLRIVHLAHAAGTCSRRRTATYEPDLRQTTHSTSGRRNWGSLEQPRTLSGRWRSQCYRIAATKIWNRRLSDYSPQETGCFFFKLCCRGK